MFLHGCPLDDDVCAGQCAGPAPAAGIKDAGGDVVMCDVNGAVIESPEDADQETKDLWKQHSELEKKLQHLRGEMGAQAAKRRKINLASPEAAAKAAAELQVAAAKATKEAAGSQDL